MASPIQSRSGRFIFGGFLLTLLLGAGIGSVLTYLALEKRGRVIVAEHDGVEEAIGRKLREWNLDPDQLKRELERGGAIVRSRSRELGTRLPADFNDVKLIAIIKAKYTLDRELSGWNIVVGSENGHVTLSGTVDSPEQIGRAVVIALDVDGVVDVASLLTVR